MHFSGTNLCSCRSYPRIGKPFLHLLLIQREPIFTTSWTKFEESYWRQTITLPSWSFKLPDRPTHKCNVNASRWTSSTWVCFVSDCGTKAVLCNLRDLAAATIGPDAVAYTEEKLGGLREFLDGQRQSSLFNIEESNVPFSKVIWISMKTLLIYSVL